MTANKRPSPAQEDICPSPLKTLTQRLRFRLKTDLTSVPSGYIRSPSLSPRMRLSSNSSLGVTNSILNLNCGQLEERTGDQRISQTIQAQSPTFSSGGQFALVEITRGFQVHETVVPDARLRR